MTFGNPLRWAKAGPDGKVEVLYVGRLPDGTVFDQNSKPQWFSLDSVISGWRSALQEAGVYEATLEFLNPAPSSLALGAVMFEQIMQQRPAVDAIFFCNDDLAQGALMAALRRGIAVPSQVAIAGFNDLTGSDQMLPPLTTVRTPRAQIGEAAAQMLLSLMRGEEPLTPQIDLGFDILQRQSS